MPWTIRAAIEFAFTLLIDVLLLVILLSGMIWLCTAANGDTYPVRSWGRNALGQNVVGEASAVCIGRSNTHSLFVTNRHVAARHRLWVADGTRWIPAEQVRLDTRSDLASFIVPGRQFKSSQLLTDVPAGQSVRMCGYFSADEPCFDGTIESRNGSQFAIASGRTSVRPGDSGGEVTVEHCGRRYCVGISRAFDQSARTIAVTSDAIQQHLTQYYRQPPRCYIWGQCHPPPNYRRIEAVDPRAFGPPRILKIEERRDSPPATPQPIPQLTDDQIRAAVNEWLEANRDSLRGRDGTDGEDGLDGTSPQIDLAALAKILAEKYADELRGPPGIPGAPGSGTGRDYEPELTSLDYRITNLENHKRRVVLQKNGVTIDEELLSIDDPLVLDIQRITSE